MTARAGLALLSVAAMAVCVWMAVAPADAQAAKPRKSACQRLTGSADLAPAKKVKLVRRRNRLGGSTLFGCVLPRGRVRRVATSAEYDHSSDAYRLRQVAGAVVLLETSSFTQYGGQEVTSVFDVRSGKSYVVASSCREILIGFCPGGGLATTTVLRAFVNERGQAAAVLVSGNGATTAIAGFSPAGDRTLFDLGPSAELPAGALAVTGSTVTWTRAGQPRSAELPG